MDGLFMQKIQRLGNDWKGCGEDTQHHCRDHQGSQHHTVCGREFASGQNLIGRAGEVALAHPSEIVIDRNHHTDDGDPELAGQPCLISGHKEEELTDETTERRNPRK